MMDLRDRVAITGLGVLAPNGMGRREFWDATKSGKSGIGPVTRFDSEPFDCHVAGELTDFNPEDFVRKAEVRRWHSHVHQSVATAQMAVDDAEFESAKYDSERVATAFGTSVGTPDEHYLRYRKTYEEEGWQKLGRYASSATSGHAATAHVSARFKLRGPASTMSTGCSTGLDVLAWGVHQIASGRADAALVGATESPITPLNFAAISALGILTSHDGPPEEAMRPFDRGGDGLVLGEGAVCVVLEKESFARARGANILGCVAGAGFASEGRNPILIDKSGEALARAIRIALKEAGMEPLDVDAIHGHGVALAMYDRGETNAYKEALGAHAWRIPISATKAMTGQTYAVGGLLNVGTALMSLNEGVMPPTLNLHDPIAECDLDYVPLVPRRNTIENALVTTLSFGGTHAAVLLSRAS